MKKLKIAIVFALISVSMLAQVKERKDTREKLEIKGDVSAFKEVSYVAIDTFGVINKGEIKTVEPNMDTNFIRKFDANGSLISESYFNEDESIKKKYMFHYNASGKLAAQDYFSFNGLESKTVYIYKGSAISEINTYNSKGAISEKAIFNYTGKVPSKKIYDSAEKLIGQELLKEDKDSKKSKSSKKSKNAKVEKITYEYEYDTEGNWIQKIMFNNRFPQFITVREFEYFGNKKETVVE